MHSSAPVRVLETSSSWGAFSLESPPTTSAGGHEQRRRDVHASASLFAGLVSLGLLGIVRWQLQPSLSRSVGSGRRSPHVTSLLLAHPSDTATLLGYCEEISVPNGGTIQSVSAVLDTILILTEFLRARLGLPTAGVSQVMTM